MDFTIFWAVLLALVAYRLVSPLVDLLNPLTAGTRKAGSSASGSNSWTEIDRQPDPRGGEKITFAVKRIMENKLLGNERCASKIDELKA